MKVDKNKVRVIMKVKLLRIRSLVGKINFPKKLILNTT